MDTPIFSLNEKYAIVNMMTMIMEADSIIHPKEVEYIDSILVDFAITTTDNESMDNMDLSMCLAIIKSMSTNKLEVTKKMFMELAMIDGYIDPRERDLFESL